MLHHFCNSCCFAGLVQGCALAEYDLRDPLPAKNISTSSSILIQIW